MLLLHGTCRIANPKGYDENRPRMGTPPECICPDHPAYPEREVIEFKAMWCSLHKMLWLSLFLLLTEGCLSGTELPSPYEPNKMPVTPPQTVGRAGEPEVLIFQKVTGYAAQVWIEVAPAPHPATEVVRSVATSWFIDGERSSSTGFSTSLAHEVTYPIHRDAEITHSFLATVVVTYADGQTAAASASTDVTFREACVSPFEFEGRLWYLECNRPHVFLMPNEVEYSPDGLLAAASEAMSAVWGTPAHRRFVQYVDLLLKRIFDGDPATPPDYDPSNYAYRPTTSPTGPYTGEERTVGEGGYDPAPLLDRVCSDIPLTGTGCLHGFLWDVDQEPGEVVFGYAPTWTSAKVTGATRTTMDVEVILEQVTYDMIYEPPHDVYDIAATSPAYIAENDLSNYTKAFGKKAGHELILRFRISSGDPRAWELVAFSRPHVVDEPYMGSIRMQPFEGLRPGPYCNANLATVAGLQPFPGMVSDTVDGTTASAPITTFTSKVSYPYPHTASSEFGGSGVGRDRLGVNAPHFSYGGSDNAFNCMRPADACTVAGEQDGGPDWIGVSEGCEYPNVSNDGDDATYEISEAIVRRWVYFY